MVQQPNNFGEFSDGQTPIASGNNSGGWRTFTKFVISIISAGAQSFTNMPAALTELIATDIFRHTEDLTYCTQFRLQVGINVAGFAGSTLGIQYSLDGGTNWFGLDNGTADVISTVTLLLTSNGHIVTAWTDIATLGRADVLLRIVGIDGNGAVDPSFNTLEVQFR